nr:recombinase-like helix-turn-helix domain-containing protein [Qipengyuania qiaonensis]
MVARQARAAEFNGRVGQAIAEIQSGGTTSLAGIARALNEEGIRTARGGKWQATQVCRVLASIENID